MMVRHGFDQGRASLRSNSPLKQPVGGRRRRLAACAILCVLAGTAWAHTAQAGVCLVDASATGNNTGTSWADAYTDLQLALSKPATCTEIWVASGVYTPGWALSDTFNVQPGTALYGGFDGHESTRAARDPGNNPTILSGDIDGDDRNVDGNNVAESRADLLGNNSYHVLVLDGTTGTPITHDTILDGFIITAGNANQSYDQGRGGGLYCNGNGGTCSPTLRNLMFSGNHAQLGGAIFNQGSQGTCSPQIINTTFRGNTARYDGGAIYNNGDHGVSSPSLEDVIFINNSADDDGGAIFNTANDYYGNPNSVTSPAMKQVLFINNSAGDDGGAIANIADDGAVTSPHLHRATFSGNQASNKGGAIYNSSAYQATAAPTVSNATFYNNTASKGGAVYNEVSYSGNTSPILSNVTFSHNTATEDGGAIYNDSAGGQNRPEYHYVTFSGNVAGGSGGAMANNGHESPTIVSKPLLENVIFWGNAASSGQQMHNYSPAAVAVIKYSVVQGGCPARSNCSVVLTDSPKLGTLQDNGGGMWTMLPASGSPAIDAGTCSTGTDQRGILRPQGSGCDIGAIERVPGSDLIFANGFNPPPAPTP